MAVKGDALKTNITKLGPLVSPFTEQLMFLVTLLKRNLVGAKLTYVLTKAPPKEVAKDISPDELKKLETWWDHDLKAKCYMLASMSNELQRRFEEAMNAASIHLHLQELYGAQTRAERFTTVKALMTTRMREGTSVHEHGVRMIGYIERLVSLDMVLPHELLVDVLLLSLPDSFDGFVVNFNMNKIEATLEELINMLTSFEATMKKEKPVLLVGSSSRANKWPKGKGKKRSAPTRKNKPIKKRLLNAPKSDKKDDVCYHCKQPGHWMRNFKDYLAQKRSEKGDDKKQEAPRKNATFLEKEFLLDRKGSVIELEEVQVQPIEDPTPQQPIEDIHTPRRSERTSRPPTRYGLILEGDQVGLEVGYDPRTFKEAIFDVDASKWLEAMQSEFDSMHFKQVWTLVDPPDGIIPIGCKWIYKRKLGVDEKEPLLDTPAPRRSERTSRPPVRYGLLLEGDQDEPDIGCDPRNFKEAISDADSNLIKDFGFIKNPEEPCVYKKVVKDAVTFLVLYVDDILLIGNDVGMLQSTKIWLSGRFSMKDLGEASYILGIQIYRDRSKRMIGLTQSTYIDTILKRFSMDGSKRGHLPMCHGVSLSKSMCPKTDAEIENMTHVPYASAIGSIMYGMISTRPDVAFALSVTSRYQSNPGRDLKLEGYTDSSFQSDVDDSKSTFGFVFMLNGGAVSWKSSKQDTTADFTTEAEYIAASAAAKEAVWMRKFVQELGVIPEFEPLLDTPAPRRSERTSRPPVRYGLLLEGDQDEPDIGCDPRNFKEAISDADSNLIKDFGFIKNPEEPCVYKKVVKDAVTFLVLYVDDILLIGNDVGMLQSTKIWLSGRFSMKDLGEASYILGIQIYRDRSKRMIGLTQSTYIDTILKRFSMDGSKRGHLPMCHGVSLSKSMCPKTDAEIENMTHVPYASAIGSIMYGMISTRPDVAFALSVTSRYQSNPGRDLKLEGYTDSSFQSDVDDSKSTFGFVFMLNGGAVSWKSSKQDTTADFTTEAEYIAASAAAKEAVWMRKFVQELGVIPEFGYLI
ncbi:uncharacterized protein [Henckelia pumila]|uniref:uncharacterized protein n=1 Tax=Henckelia pumila TaxID=405737 RepID=UPI003C6E77DB